MVAAYLDGRLPPHPSHPDGRTFSSEHLTRAPDKPVTGPGRLAIHQAEIIPPRFCLVNGTEIVELAKVGRERERGGREKERERERREGGREGGRKEGKLK